jgi:formylglycine-generating enzyme required for sulfatase activity
VRITLIGIVLGVLAIQMPAAAIEPQATRSNRLGMVFVWIAPGQFVMGSPVTETGRSRDEWLHPVIISRGFYLQRTEVTQGQWMAVMGANPAHFVQCGPDCPVEQVSWDDVQAFISALNALGDGRYRLPSEEEWEYACRAGTQSARSWGDAPVNACRHANVADHTIQVIYPTWETHDCDDGEDMPKPVASFAPNAWGLHDMLGNVWEWCHDLYAPYPGTPAGSAAEQEAAHRDRRKRVNRGGGWSSSPRYARCAYRSRDISSYNARVLGFRLVMAE